METSIAVFRGKEIRRIIHNNEWWFSIVDVVEALSGTDRPRKYWSDLKNKLTAEGYIEVSGKIGQLKMPAPDGKMRETECANTETMFRIIQSIPSPKAEPFKRWLAKVGYERVQLERLRWFLRFERLIDAGLWHDLGKYLEGKYFERSRL